MRSWVKNIRKLALTLHCSWMAVLPYMKLNMSPFFPPSDVVELLLGQPNVELNQQVRLNFTQAGGKHPPGFCNTRFSVSEPNELL